MTKEALIKKMLVELAKLPEDKVKEVSNFAESIIRKNDTDLLDKGIQKIISKTKSYEFLQTEEDLYNVKDLKERYS